MPTIDEILKSKGLGKLKESPWRVSPTVNRYTDFSKIDLKGIVLSEEVAISKSPKLANSEYVDVSSDHDVLLDLNRAIQNFRSSLSLDKDAEIVFGKNSAVIGNLDVKVEKDAKLRIELGEYKLFCLTLHITCSEGVSADVDIESKGSGITYLRIKKTLSKRSKLVLTNRHIKDRFLFLYGDGLLEEGSSLDSNVYAYADSGSHYDCVQNADHLGMASTSNVIGRGVIDGPSSLVFRGMLKIHKEKCNGNFATKTLNISNGDAFTDSVPMLDIKANNVIARHSSSIENISREELFYLASRGFGEKEASKLVIDSMLGLEE